MASHEMKGEEEMNVSWMCICEKGENTLPTPYSGGVTTKLCFLHWHV